MTTNTRSTYPDAIPGLSDEARRLIRAAADQLDARWDLDAAEGLHDGDRFAFADEVGRGRFYGDELMPKLRALIGEPMLRLHDPDGHAARVAARKKATAELDPKTCEFSNVYRAVEDPYGDFVDHYGTCRLEVFVAAPRSGSRERVWVLHADLPEMTRAALEARSDRARLSNPRRLRPPLPPAPAVPPARAPMDDGRQPF